jgi:hypothetical protein
MRPMKALLVLLPVLFLGGSHSALAADFGGTCGFPFSEDPTAQREFLDIGSQFQVRNVRIAPHPQGVLVEGEIFNGLQGFFTFALFKVQLFNADCTYLGANNFAINEFKFGVTGPFRVIVPNVEVDEVAMYQIEFLPH